MLFGNMIGRDGAVPGLDMDLCVFCSDFYLSEEALLMSVSAGFRDGSRSGRTHPA